MRGSSLFLQLGVCRPGQESVHSRDRGWRILHQSGLAEPVGREAKDFRARRWRSSEVDGVRASRSELTEGAYCGGAAGEWMDGFPISGDQAWRMCERTCGPKGWWTRAEFDDGDQGRADVKTKEGDASGMVY